MYKASILSMYDISVSFVGINKYNSRNHTDCVIRSWLKWIISIIHNDLMLELINCILLWCGNLCAADEWLYWNYIEMEL